MVSKSVAREEQQSSRVCLHVAKAKVIKKGTKEEEDRKFNRAIVLLWKFVSYALRAIY